MPQPSEYGTECREDFWRAAGFQYRVFWNSEKLDSDGEERERQGDRHTRKQEVRTQKVWFFSMDFFISGLPP